MRPLYTRWRDIRKGDWTLYVPLWLQMMIFIGIATLVSMLVLAVVTIVKTWQSGSSIVAQKLSYFAATKAITIKETITGLQSDIVWSLNRPVITDVLAERRSGNYSNAGYQQLSSYLTNMLTIKPVLRAVVIYDNQLNQTYFRAQADTNAPLTAILASMSALLPLQSTANLDVEQILKHRGILQNPVPVVSQNKQISSSLSITIPILTADNGSYTTSVVGYGTVVISGSGTWYDSDNSTESVIDNGKLTVGVSAYDGKQEGFRFIFASGTPADTRTPAPYSDFYPFTAFPAMSSAAKLSANNHSDSDQPRGALLNTHTPLLRSASVGYSYADVLGSRWYVCIELSKDVAFQQVRKLRQKLIGLCAGIFVFALLLIYPTGRIMTHPLYRIYHGMEFTQTTGIGPRNTPPGFGPNKMEGKPLRYPFSWRRIYPRLRSRPPLEKHVSDYAQSSTVMGRVRTFARRVTPDILPSVNTVTPIAPVDTTDGFQVPALIPPLGRLYRDELDDLVDEYNAMVNRLNNQYRFLDDQVRVRTQEAQEARLLAENANKAKSQFIANITHELRTPLNGIMGMTSVTLGETSLPKVHKSLQVIIESGRILMELLNELLAFSKSQVDMKVNITEFEPRELIDNLSGMFLARAEAKSLSVTAACDPPALAHVKLRGDFFRILQIVVHIMSNSIKFSESSGSVSITIRLQVSRETQNIRQNTQAGVRETMYPIFQVIAKDTGPGIADAQLKNIFEPFVQGDDAYSKKYQGTGLGMSMCKQLAETIGGCVLVWSSKGEGTCVVLEAPVQIPNPEIPFAALESDNSAWEIKNGFFTASNIAGSVRQMKGYTRMPGKRRLPSLDMAAARKAPLVDSTSGTPITTLTCASTDTDRRRFSIIDALVGLKGSPLAKSHTDLDKRPSVSPVHNPQRGLVQDTADLNIISRSEASSGGKEKSTSVSQLGSQPPRIDGFKCGEQKSLAERQKKFLADDHSNVKVLVADDNNLNLQIMRAMLERSGINNIDTVSDGEAVVSLVEKSIRDGVHYTIIFIDLVMPGVNGLEAAQILRTTLAYPYPIVALTGFTDVQTFEMCKAANIQEVISKPIMFDKLLDILVRYAAP